MLFGAICQGSTPLGTRNLALMRWSEIFVGLRLGYDSAYHANGGDLKTM